MRLIDADKLKADVVSWENCYNGFSDTYDKAMIIDTIDEQPTIDAVPVVRCGECDKGEEIISGTDPDTDPDRDPVRLDVCRGNINESKYL